jgi:hypothetical protein
VRLAENNNARLRAIDRKRRRRTRQHTRVRCPNRAHGFSTRPRHAHDNAIHRFRELYSDVRGSASIDGAKRMNDTRGQRAAY